MKKLLTSLLGLFLIAGAHAQMTEYFLVEMGGSFTQLVDEPYSPLLYSGWSATLGLGNSWEGERSEWMSRFQGGYGELSAPLDQGARFASSSVSALLFSFELNNYRLLRSWGKGSVWLGGAWATQYDQRIYNFFTNNVNGYEVRTLLEGGSFFRYALSDYHRLQGGLQIPLAGFAARPGYLGTQILAEDLETDVLEMYLPDQWVSWHNLRYLRTHLQWRWVQANGHLLVVTYRWQGGVNVQARRLAYGRHQLGIAYHFLTKKALNE